MTDTFTPDTDLDAGKPDPAPAALDAGKPDPAPAAPRTRSKPRRSSSRRSSSRTATAGVRQVAEKADQLARAGADEREVLASLLGAPSDGVVDLTVTIMESPRNPVRSAIDDLRTIQDSNLPVATIHLVGMDKDAHEALVALLRVAGLADGLPDRIPTRATDAALALIGPVRDADVDTDTLDRLLALLDR